MPKTKHRVIVDTNIWISFLLTRKLSKIDKLLKEDRIVLLFSKELLEEFTSVAQRPKFKNYFSKTDLNALLSSIHLKAEYKKVTSKIKLCRDPKDNFLLALARDAKATHIITGDEDLLVLEKFEHTHITTIKAYLYE